MVKKLLSLFTLCLIFSATAFAQSGTITGTITDESSGETLPSVNVYIVELQRGAATNAQGEFTIEGVEYGTYTVRASFVGYNTFEQQVTVDQSTVTLDIPLSSSMQQLDDVVVTAYGVEQSMNDLPYSAQQVDGDIVAESRSDNFAASLSGRVSGLKVSQSNGMGGSTNIVMRGYTSISGNNQVLFVVDGVPYANQEFNDANTEAGFAGYDYGNTGVDINPDNIASVNVLKGPAAAALYGSRASNGAIVIETKGGRKGSRATQVTFNSSASIQTINKSTFVDHQMQYGGGYFPSFGSIDIDGDGTEETIGNPWDDGSYGPKFEGQSVYQWDAFVEGGPNFMTATPWVAPENTPMDFFKTGTDFTNSIQIDGGFEGGYYNMGYNQTNTTGIIPNAKLDKNKLNFAAGYDVSDKLSVSGKIQYSQTSGHARPARGYSTMMSLYRQWWNTSVDIEDQKRAYFRNRTNETWNWAQGNLGGSPIYWNNPYWDRYENFSTDERDRYFGNVEANYQVVDWLSLTGRISVDSYSQLIEERNNVSSIGHGTDYAGYYRMSENFTEFNYDVLANYKKQLNEDIRVSGVVGMNLRRNHEQAISAQTNGGLVVPGLYSLSNSVNSIQYPNETDQQLGVNGYFASLNVNYGGFFTVEATGRRDKASSLPEGENVYYYPSVSAGFTFSEFVDADWLSFGKIRGSWAQVGNTAPPYSVTDTYSRPSNFGSAGLYTLPSTKNNPNLKPERTKSWEVGIQLGVFNDRATLDVNYYDMNTVDQILATEVSRSTGYSTKFVNAGNVENRGWEVSATVRPISSRDFTWTMNVNWSKNINKVKELAPGISNYQLASPQGGVSISAAEGQPYGAIRGTDFVNLDGESWSENGGRKLTEAGFYAVTSSSNNIIGNMNPDWTGGISNRLNYQNFSLNFLVDVRWGGDIFSLDQYYGQGTGLYPITAGNNDLGNPKRNSLANGGGVILDGYKADGSKNDVRAYADNYTGAYGWVSNPAAQFIYDGSYVKLREVGLTYNLPQNLLDKVGPIKGASVSAIGRNLWIIHKNLPHADPEQGIVAGNVQGYQGGAYPSTRNFTFNLKLEF
ncbi:SusC/RagA family TonB-linked outer membrane protein [Fodinibius sp.]|uniref:SusC/RagA family TonB-linked outer membrane protein n=1 Tax=Fodinibius sp. TaxID=1872440 RepID=UPI002ACDE29D|nr:SusC/RagA family TonB-linked outer membrane protein [Fodinibius sp.]MDZ7659541.1 SusC/RagA family TonB-linked outer membrane protein [Fodinibius sp.]